MEWVTTVGHWERQVEQVSLRVIPPEAERVGTFPPTFQAVSGAGCWDGRLALTEGRAGQLCDQRASSREMHVEIVLGAL